MRIVSLFSGIGAFEKALSDLKIDYDLVAFSEIDKFAITAYCSIHGVSEDLNLGDITEIDPDSVPDCDFISHGSPCQSYSVAGKNAGGDKGSGTRSSLMWHTVDIVGHKMPKYVLWENVKGVLSKRHKHNFELYLDDLEDLGYNNYYKVLNAKDFGVPQNRERVYVISVRKDVDDELFEFPKGFPSDLRLKDVLDDEVEEKYFIKNDRVDKLLEDLLERGYLDGEKVEVESDGGVLCTINSQSYECSSDLKNPEISRSNEPNIVASRGRNPRNPSDRMTGGPTEQRLEMNMQGTTNTITTVQKDNLVLEPKIMRYERTEYGKEIRKQYESGEIREKMGNMRVLTPRPDANCNTITTVQKDNLLLDPKSHRLGGLYDKDGRRHQAGAVWDDEGVAPTVDTMQGGNREPLIVKSNVVDGYVERKYIEFVEEHGYFPEVFNPYNCSDLVEMAPTVTTQCGSTTSSSTVLLAEGEGINELLFVGGLGDKDLAGDGKGLSRNYPQGNRVYDPNGVACSQTANGGGLGGPTGLYLTSYRIRKLTPLECWRLMGFDDTDYWIARGALEETHYNGRDRSNSQMYKMAGNSIVVNVLEAIFKSLILK